VRLIQFPFGAGWAGLDAAAAGFWVGGLATVVGGFFATAVLGAGFLGAEAAGEGFTGVLPAGGFTGALAGALEGGLVVLGVDMLNFQMFRGQLEKRLFDAMNIPRARFQDVAEEKRFKRKMTAKDLPYERIHSLRSSSDGCAVQQSTSEVGQKVDV
jgi:hypothetical protein